MNKKKRIQVVIVVAAVFLCGIVYICLGPGRASTVSGEAAGDDVFVAGGSRTDVSADEAEVDATEKSRTSSGAEIVANAVDKPNEAVADKGDKLSGDSSGGVFIYICGEVKNPGVYSFESPPRVVEVVEKAGGFTKKADETSVNLASEVQDGAQIYISGKSKDGSGQGALADSGGVTAGGEGAGSDDRIDINTAGHEELMQIPGIGDAKATAIENYRTEHGRFEKPEELMQISGIKQGTFDKLKDYIRV